MSAAVCKIGKADQIDRLIAHCAALGLSGRVELLRAVRTREIALIESARDGVFRMPENLARPVIVLLGDDDYATTGPTGWATTRRLLHWAKAGLVHASGADVTSYQA